MERDETVVQRVDREQTPDDPLERAGCVAREAAIAAGDLIVTHVEAHGRTPETVDTAVSRSEQVLLTAIDSEFPDDDVFTGGDLPDGRVWVVDAVDGHTNLEHGNPNYATSIALLIDGRPTVGVVYAPVFGECFQGICGRGAVRNGVPIEPTDRDSLDESLLLSGYDPDGEFLQTCYRHARGVRRIGSQALSLCYVAAGSADGCWEFDTRPHDVAAGLCLLSAAGGRASTPEGTPFRLDTGTRTPLLVSNGPLHPALLEVLTDE